MTRKVIIEGEGSTNGIRWITSKFYNEGEYKYNVLALGIRGFYWWFLTLMSLMLYINPIYVCFGILILAIGFPLSVIIATKKLGDSRAWELAEHYYGLIQDVVLLGLLLLLFFTS
jgi:hypothetical protein